jgi:hypothetical protein
MKNPGRKIAPFLATFFCVLLLCTMVTYAASTTLMTYSGTGIRDKASVKTFTLSSTTTITVHHTTTGFEKNLPVTKYVEISLLRKTGFSFYKTGDSFCVYEANSGSKSWRKDSGTYRLNFRTYGSYQGEWAGANIRGSVTMP